MDATQNWVSLGQFALGAEAEIVESLLETFEVPFFRRYDREGAFTHIYLGNSRIPVEIMVPHDRLSEARELLENHIAGSEESDAGTEADLADINLIGTSDENTAKGKTIQ